MLEEFFVYPGVNRAESRSGIDRHGRASFKTWPRRNQVVSEREEPPLFRYFPVAVRETRTLLPSGVSICLETCPVRTT